MIEGEDKILDVEEVTVSFDGFKALDHLSLHVEGGELRCIIGPNGAGKTTMIDVITGKTKPDHGAVTLGRHLDLLPLDEAQIATAGVGRKFQKPTVFENLTVFDNLELAMHGDKRVRASLFAVQTPAAREEIEEVMETVGLSGFGARQAGTLAHGQKQWLELGMLVMQRPKLLLVDEPVAGMTQQEIEHTGELLASLAGDCTVIVIEHDMEFVQSIARRVSVLHEGRVLAEGSMETVQNNPEVIEVYLGD